MIMTTIRKATVKDAASIARVHVDSWRTTYKGIINQSYLDQLCYEEKEKIWRAYFHKDTGLPIRNDTALIVATCDNEVVGFVTGGPERKKAGIDAELYAIYLRDTYQRQGIGQRLLSSLITELEKCGNSLKNMLVRVIPDNRHGAFYRKLGAVDDHEVTFQLSGQTLTEVALRWDDIPRLKQLCSS